jgi:hypothetical protein
MTRMDLSAPLNQRSLFLPLDGRTLLKTMRSVSSRIVSPGTYNHFLLERGLVRCLDQCQFDKNCNSISIFISTGGVPLTKSNCFWPILVTVIKPRIEKTLTIGI